VNWALDADIRGAFDTLSQERLVQFVEQRLAARRLVPASVMMSPDLMWGARRGCTVQAMTRPLFLANRSRMWQGAHASKQPGTRSTGQLRHIGIRPHESRLH
jgi:hypothetical protein